MQLPNSIRHLETDRQPSSDGHITITLISDDPINQYLGFQELYTALVPFDEVDDFLNAEGSTSYQVEAWGPQPIVEEDETFESNFYIRGKNNQEYESLIHSWERHNKTVMVPDNAMLMCYGLTPRIPKKGLIYWDDPSKPVYDVLRVNPLSTYDCPNHSPASITIRSDYLEDYLSLKKCAAVAVYYDERFSNNDDIFNSLLDGKNEVQFELPGKLVLLRKVEKEYFNGCEQFIRVWGRQLLLKPGARPISQDEEPTFIWPDHDEPISPRLARDMRCPLHFVYTRDDILKEFEEYEEYNVFPESGNIGYDGWWGTSRNQRRGRNYIRIDLKKLYEGTPNHIIHLFHKYAVPKKDVDEDIAIYGDENIATITKGMIESYMQLITSIVNTSYKVNLLFNEGEIGGYSREELARIGFWYDIPIRKLANVSEKGMTKQVFLSRCSNLYQFFENLKPSPLKQLILRFGIPKDYVKSLRSLLLLATLSQLCVVSLEEGINIIEDMDIVREKWNKDLIIPEISPLFALNTIRNLEDHISGSNFDDKFYEAMETFAIEPDAHKYG